MFEPIFWMLLPFIVLAGIIAAVFFIQKKFKWWFINRGLNARRSAYLESLNRLKQMPENATQKAHTWRKGQEYVQLIAEIIEYKAQENIRSFSRFDESTLTAEIEAACNNNGEDANVTVSKDKSLEERLRHLSELRTKNLISDGEFEEKRKQILNDI